MQNSGKLMCKSLFETDILCFVIVLYPSSRAYMQVVQFEDRLDGVVRSHIPRESF